jgi:hypothetical protein
VIFCVKEIWREVPQKELARAQKTGKEQRNQARSPKAGCKGEMLLLAGKGAKVE